MQAEIKEMCPNDHLGWSEFAQYDSLDPYDDFGWFHVTVGVTGEEGGHDFQVCVATPRSVGRVKPSGSNPGILVDRFDAESVSRAIRNKVASITGTTWEQIIDQLRTFMLWEYEGMAGS